MFSHNLTSCSTAMAHASNRGGLERVDARTEPTMVCVRLPGRQEEAELAWRKEAAAIDRTLRANHELNVCGPSRRATAG